MHHDKYRYRSSLQFSHVSFRSTCYTTTSRHTLSVPLFLTECAGKAEHHRYFTECEIWQKQLSLHNEQHFGLHFPLYSFQWIFGWPLSPDLPSNYVWYTEEEKLLALIVMDRWTSFAKYGLVSNTRDTIIIRFPYGHLT